jgi:hypothetical protein
MREMPDRRALVAGLLTAVIVAGCGSEDATFAGGSGGAGGDATVSGGSGGASGAGEQTVDAAPVDAGRPPDSQAGEAGRDATIDATDAVARDVAGLPKCKRGLAVNDVSAADLQAFSGSVGWFYDWNLALPTKLSDQAGTVGLDFVPMIWTGDPDVADAVSRIPVGAKYLLGFNEPNFKTQGNLSAEAAAAIWPKLEQIAKARDLLLVSPAVNFCGPESECWATDPFAYLDAFFAACTGCQVDFIALHGYFDNAGGLSWYIGEAKKRYAKPIWLTEFNQSPGDAAAQAAFMQQALPMLESEPMVFRYSWFMARSTATTINLLAADGTLTDLGRLYATLAPADCAP